MYPGMSDKANAIPKTKDNKAINIVLAREYNGDIFFSEKVCWFLTFKTMRLKEKQLLKHLHMNQFWKFDKT